MSDHEIALELASRFAGFDPATIYEAAGLKGMVDPAIRPAWAGARVCGPALTVICPPGDNLMLHHAVANAQPGVVIVATLGSYMLTGAWGEILTVAAQKKGIAGLVVDGAIRDIDAIARKQFSAFSRGLAIGSCTKNQIGALNVPILFGGIRVNPGDIVVGDPDGVVVVECRRAEDVYQAALRRNYREKEIMEQIAAGKTTVEILSLPPYPKEGVAKT